MGAWAQAYQALFAKPLLNQVIAIIQRDQQSALNVINAARAVDGNQPLSAIQEFHKGPGERLGWPWLFLEIAGTSFSRTNDVTTRHSITRVALALDTGQFDTEMAQEDAHDYARLLDLIITSAGPFPCYADWTAALPIKHETVPSGTTVPNAVGTVNDVFVESHVPMRVAIPDRDAPVMRITVTVAFELEEV